MTQHAVPPDFIVELSNGQLTDRTIERMEGFLEANMKKNIKIKQNSQRPGKWIDDIFKAVGHFVHLETKDGTAREGQLSCLRTESIEVNGFKREIPVAIELNGDNFDYIDLSTIQRITID